MILTPQTRLNKALDLGPQVVDYIVSLNPNEFQRLRNPLLRRLMAPRTTLERVAAMVQVPADALVQEVARLTGATAEQAPQRESLPAPAAELPAWVLDAGPATTQLVDLLPLDQSLDADPMLPVMNALKSLATGQVCLIKHKWEPQPLYDVWAKMGSLEWFSQQVEDDEWWIWVRRVPH